MKKILVITAALLSLSVAAKIGSAQPKKYFIPSGNMEPTIKLRSVINVQKNPFQSIAQVQRGNIIVHQRIDKDAVTKGSIIEVVQRVVALPGDHVEMVGTTVRINGRKLPHRFIKRSGKETIYQETNGKANYQVQYERRPLVPTAKFSTIVPAGKLLCIGDNRDNSYDSRFAGATPFQAIVGKRVP